MKRYICIHGHFYQPPRENPWLEAIEQQDKAHPYHDWNERITAECYAPNSAARILNKQGKIEQIVNNYERISFNFGPTLLAWLEPNGPEVYEAVLEADRRSQERFSGHGSALAQAFNHTILSLANHQDKFTQVLWGIRDFEHRFRRKPEGFWLPETAVDLESLEILAELGIRFTILAPRQARRIRSLEGGDWEDVNGEKIDTTRPYRLNLPSGRNIALFFYHGTISRAVAFDGVLRDGESFAQRLLNGFSEGRHRPHLVHIATDGETYGHHHRFGEMALAYALNYLETKKLARLTNYGEYLERHPPDQEVEIFENTSWSCAHGVERWQSDCGCNSGMRPEWNQKWRAPLLGALDWLRDTVCPWFEEKSGQFLKEPWKARNDYIHLILQRSPEVLGEFLASHEIRPLTEAERVTVLKLMELQRHSMLMYTSCGWFFDDLSGIETVQVLQYAGRAVQLSQEIFGDDVESRFLERLSQAKSNRLEAGDGRKIYENNVKPSMFDLARVGAHYGVGSLFETYPEQVKLYCYSAERLDHRSYEAGRAKLVLGETRVTSEITLESAVLGFSALHLGDHNLIGGVREFSGGNSYASMAEQMTGAFTTADLAETIRVLDKNFGDSTYTIKTLFSDEQRRILDRILKTTLDEIETAYRQLYERHAVLLQFLKEERSPVPKGLYTAAEFALNVDLHRAFAADELNLNRIEHLLKEARLEGVSLDALTLEYSFSQALERLARGFADEPADLELLEKLKAAVELVGRLPFEVNLWKVQNGCYEIVQTSYGEFERRAEQGDTQASEWLNHFKTIAESLFIQV